MNFAAKLTTAILAGVLTLIAIEGYVSMRRNVRLFDENMEEHALLLGHALRPVVVAAWRSGGEPEARAALTEAGAEAPTLEVALIPSDRMSDELGWIGAAGLAALARGEDVSMKREDVTPGVRSTLVHLAMDGVSLGVIELEESLSVLASYRREAMLQTLVLVLVIALSSVVAVRALGLSMVGRPLQALVEKTRRVGAGDLDGPLELSGDDELQELASALNHMCEDLGTSREETLREHQAKLRAVEQARHKDRLHALGKLAAGVAHELGTPLNVITGRAEMIARGGRSTTEVTEFAEIIRTQADRMNGIIRELLLFGRGRGGGRGPTRLDSLARSVIDMMEPLAAEHGVTLDLDARAVPVVDADQTQVQQVITNLVLNAVQASQRGARVAIRLDHERAKGSEGVGVDEAVLLTVEDFGAGMAKDTLDRLFDPFFTTKGVGSGTGLGLSIAHEIVVDHGGRIEVTSEPGRGSRFDVRFPVARHG